MKFFVLLFSLLFVQVMTVAQEDPPPAQDIPESAETVSGDVGIYVRFQYEFEAAASDRISVVVRTASNTIDPAVSLFDPEGNLLAYNDNHNTREATLGKYDALIENPELPVTGTYTIEVSNNFWSVGEIELVILKGETVSLADLDPIPVDSPQTATFVAGTRSQSDGQCTAHVETIPARLRFQPTLQSRVDRLLYPGTYLEVDGFYQREGTAVWYRVLGYLWVREDAIILEGDCSRLQIL